MNLEEFRRILVLMYSTLEMLRVAFFTEKRLYYNTNSLHLP